MWILRESGQDDGLTFRLRKGSVKTVGRAARADFIVDASLVSRLHCRLTVRPDGTLEIQDLESTNGTYVNGRKVDRADLKDGDEIGIGRIRMKAQQIQ